MLKTELKMENHRRSFVFHNDSEFRKYDRVEYPVSKI